MTTLAIGIDIGGTGIKGAVVDVGTGELKSERVKVATPDGGEPEDIVAAVVEMADGFGEIAADAPVGVCFPAIILDGRTMSAANVSKRWVGLEAEKLFESALNRNITFVNDADAAGVAEVRYGAAKGQSGLVILTTLGTGIGTAFLYNGTLIPNTELGHMELDGKEAEKRMSYAAKERKGLDWEQWAERLQSFYSKLELLFSPTLFIVGGGVSKSDHEFLPLIELKTPIIPAAFRNNAGIMGAAALAADS